MRDWKFTALCLSLLPSSSVNSLAMTWWMLVYQSRRFSLTKDLVPDSPLSLLVFFLHSSLNSSVFPLFSSLLDHVCYLFFAFPFPRLGLHFSHTSPAFLWPDSFRIYFLCIWLSEVMQGWLRFSKSNLDHCDYSLVWSLSLGGSNLMEIMKRPPQPKAHVPVFR